MMQRNQKETVPNCQTGSESLTAGIYSAMVYMPWLSIFLYNQHFADIKRLVHMVRIRVFIPHLELKEIFEDVVAGLPQYDNVQIEIGRAHV